jgi:uncharacterized membrane protein HdeD (DUF308 family)
MNTTMLITPDIEALRRKVRASIHAHWKLFLAQGILMVLLGMLAVALPNISTVAIELLVGWLFIIGGIIRAITMSRKRHMPGFWWALFTVALSVAVGALLIVRPLQGVVSLTIVMAALFIGEGVAAIFIALEYRRHLTRWGWTVFGGLINLWLAFLIWRGWPNTATWVIGLYVGLYMIFLGIPLVVTAIAARSLGPTAQ